MTRRHGHLALIDRLMIAGSVAGAAYLIALYLFRVHGNVAVMLGVLVAGYALGRGARLPHLRSPITWRKGRGR